MCRHICLRRRLSRHPYERGMSSPKTNDPNTGKTYLANNEIDIAFGLNRPTTMRPDSTNQQPGTTLTWQLSPVPEINHSAFCLRRNSTTGLLVRLTKICTVFVWSNVEWGGTRFGVLCDRGVAIEWLEFGVYFGSWCECVSIRRVLHPSKTQSQRFRQNSKTAKTRTRRVASLHRSTSLSVSSVSVGLGFVR